MPQMNEMLNEQMVGSDAGGRPWIDISIPLRFNGPQPNAYGVEPALSEAVEAGTLVGDTRRGGSCNFERTTFIPHCNGTHTECVGHITNERISVRACLREAFMTARLISVEPDIVDGERLITQATLERAMGENRRDALIVRTLPNDDSKLTREYGENNIPPYFTAEAMRHIAAEGVKHLLVDLPSIDRILDEGKLTNHRIFWKVAEGSFEIGPETAISNTVTELIYVPNEAADGEYFLNLQIAPFESDAAPSRPLICPTN